MTPHNQTGSSGKESTIIHKNYTALTSDLGLGLTSVIQDRKTSEAQSLNLNCNHLVVMPHLSCCQLARLVCIPCQYFNSHGIAATTHIERNQVSVPQSGEHTASFKNGPCLETCCILITWSLVSTFTWSSLWSILVEDVADSSNRLVLTAWAMPHASLSSSSLLVAHKPTMTQWSALRCPGPLHSAMSEGGFPPRPVLHEFTRWSAHQEFKLKSAVRRCVICWVIFRVRVTLLEMLATQVMKTRRNPGPRRFFQVSSS